jgi:hypothetical protein
MTYSEQYNENIKYSEESEKRLVDKIRNCGALAELESRQHFPERFNSILTGCKNNTARLERGKPDILMLTSVLNENTALYVEGKTRLPKYYGSKKFTINIQQIEDYRNFETCNKLKTILAFEDPYCCYMDYLDNYNFGDSQFGRYGSSNFYYVYESDILTIDEFMNNIDQRAIIALTKKI